MPVRPIYLFTCLLPLSLVSACSLFSSVPNSVVDRDHDWSRVTLAGSGFDIVTMQRLDGRLDAGEYRNS